MTPTHLLDDQGAPDRPEGSAAPRGSTQERGNDMKGPSDRDEDPQKRYWRRRASLDAAKFVIWLVVELIKEHGSGPWGR
ncbi:hypothetical protein GCM10010151_37260 [Actinoallomurus spadix]|uniref:Transposase n=1 Tax=Actinoallomurus spadix TaxID=79912 RepID=A0ABN0WQE6_9ACTN